VYEKQNKKYWEENADFSNLNPILYAGTMTVFKQYHYVRRTLLSPCI